VAVVEVQITEVIVVKSEQSIGLLNKSVADELAAVHQYMYFHFHLDDLGFNAPGEPVQAYCDHGNGPRGGAGRADSLPEG